jgi:hypothetical protein
MTLLLAKVPVMSGTVGDSGFNHMGGWGPHPPRLEIEPEAETDAVRLPVG